MGTAYGSQKTSPLPLYPIPVLQGPSWLGKIVEESLTPGLLLSFLTYLHALGALEPFTSPPPVT